MIETAIFLMQLASVAAIVAGAVLTVSHLLEREASTSASA
jgi:hypothetical protein